MSRRQGPLVEIKVLIVPLCSFVKSWRRHKFKTAGFYAAASAEKSHFSLEELQFRGSGFPILRRMYGLRFRLPQSAECGVAKLVA